MPTKVGNGGYSQENYDPTTGRYVKAGTSSDVKYYNLGFNWDDIEDEYDNIDFNPTNNNVNSNQNDYEELKKYLSDNVNLIGNASKEKFEKLLNDISQADEKSIQRVNNFFKTDFGKSISIEFSKNNSGKGRETKTYWSPIIRILRFQDTNDARAFFHEVGHAMNSYIAIKNNKSALSVETSKYNDIFKNIKSQEKNNDFNGIDNFVKDFASMLNIPEIKHCYDFYKTMHFLGANSMPQKVEEKYVNSNYASICSKNKGLIAGVSDFISSLTDGEIHLGFGHSKNYWEMGEDNPLDEFFANMNAYSAAKNENIIEFVKKHYPVLVNGYKEIINDIDKTFGGN